MTKKEMLVSELIILLEQLPANYSVSCNEVRNLWVGDENMKYTGYIDFLTKEVELFHANNT